MRRPRSLLVAAGAAVTLLAALVTAPAAQARPYQPGKPIQYVIKDPSHLWTHNCTADVGPFADLPGGDGHLASHTLYGVQGGASWHIEYPATGWNGQLVLWAHGYNGTGNLLCAGTPNIDRQWYIDHGYAWAASSYADNGYDVSQGVKDTHDLIGLFRSRVAKPSKVWITGESMGGHVVAVSIEQYPNAYAGAMPSCGVLADDDLFSYFLDAGVTAAGLAGQRAPYPVNNEDWTQFVDTKVLPEVGSYLQGSPRPTRLFSAWDSIVVNQSGGPRPGAANALLYWSSFGFGDPPLNTLPFLYGVYPGTTDGTIGVAVGNVADNTGTVYRITSKAGQELTTQEQALNATVTRVAADPNTRSHGLAGIPRVAGDPSVPVLSLHGLGDLFVPFSMEEKYAARVAANGKSDLFVSRAIRNATHCGFSQTELTQGFQDLVRWVEKGQHPAGDAVTDPAAVAADTFGCQFTDSAAYNTAPTPVDTRSAFYFSPCPTAGP